jgi:hypothetical protein
MSDQKRTKWATGSSSFQHRDVLPSTAAIGIFGEAVKIKLFAVFA